MLIAGSSASKILTCAACHRDDFLMLAKVGFGQLGQGTGADKVWLSLDCAVGAAASCAGTGPAAASCAVNSAGDGCDGAVAAVVAGSTSAAVAADPPADVAATTCDFTPASTSVACLYVSGGPATDADGVEAIIGITPPSHIKYSECKATDQASKYFLYIVNSGKVANIGVETDIRPLNAAEIVACTPPAPVANAATQHSLLTMVNLAAAVVLVHGLQ